MCIAAKRILWYNLIADLSQQKGQSMKIKKVYFKQLLAFLLVLTMLCSVFTSCAANIDDLDTHSDSNNSYIASDESKIVIDDNTTDESNIIDSNAISIFANGTYTAKLICSNNPSTLDSEIYNQLTTVFKNYTKVNPICITDSAAAGEEKYDGPAILIGNTNYPESKEANQALNNRQATATVSGNKYVIAFSSKKAAEKLITSLKSLLSKKATKDTITINSNWEINVKDTSTMTKTEWLNQYKSTLSERDMALLSQAYDVLSNNTIQGDNMPWGSSPAISPWSGSTAGLWNWDSMFHAMTVSRYNGNLAKSCIDSFAMFQKENGLLPDVIFPNGTIEDNYSKPPVYAWAVLEVYKATDDLTFLRRNYDRAVKYESFWRNERFDNGLFYYSAQENPENDNYLHPRWESGWDNSPRWDVAPIVDLYPIDLNCYMVLYYRSMAEMAKILGKSSASWESKEIALTKEIESRLYNEEISAYVDRNRKNGEYSTVLSPASFMPLFIGTASQERAEAMNKLAMDNTKFYPGMPSVSYDDKGYNNDYWRGPTWLNIAFFAVKGLDDYGFTQTANEIKEFLLDMCYDGLPYIYENYDSKTETGKCVNSFSWSAAFIIEFILQFNEKR